jgi:hypothetical protein
MKSTYRVQPARVVDRRATAAAVFTLILLTLIRMRFTDTPLLKEEE